MKWLSLSVVHRTHFISSKSEKLLSLKSRQLDFISIPSNLIQNFLKIMKKKKTSTQNTWCADTKKNTIDNLRPILKIIRTILYKRHVNLYGISEFYTNVVRVYFQQWVASIGYCPISNTYVYLIYTYCYIHVKCLYATLLYMVCMTTIFNRIIFPHFLSITIILSPKTVHNIELLHH